MVTSKRDEGLRIGLVRAATLRLATALIVGIFAWQDTARADPWPGAGWEAAPPESLGMQPGLLAQARDYALTGGGSGVIIRHGRVAMSWGDTALLYEMKSTTKSIGSLLLGIAVTEGRVGLDASAQTYYPEIGAPPVENTATGWIPSITLRQLAAHAGGFADTAGYPPLTYEPGTRWLHSDGGVDWLADVLTIRFAQDLQTVLRQRVLDVIGIPTSQLTWRDHRYRDPVLNGVARRELGSGMHASVDAMARLGYLCLRGGTWNGVNVVPASFVEQMRTPSAAITALPNLDEGTYPGAPRHHGLLWWTNSDGTLAGTPTDAFFSWGLYDSILLVIPSLDIVAARAGDGWRAGWDANYAVVAPFIEPIAKSVQPTAVEQVTWSRLHGSYR